MVGIENEVGGIIHTARMIAYGSGFNMKYSEANTGELFLACQNNDSLFDLAHLIEGQDILLREFNDTLNDLCRRSVKSVPEDEVRNVLKKAANYCDSIGVTRMKPGDFYIGTLSMDEGILAGTFDLLGIDRKELLQVTKEK
jgi:hypothetical protein